MNSKHPAQTCTLLLAAAAALSLLQILFPLEGIVTTPAGFLIQGWPHPLIRHLFPLLLLATAGFSFAAWRWTGRALANTTAGLQTPRALLQSLRPLLWLPTTLLPRHLSAWIGPQFAAFFLPYGGTFIAALTLERMTRNSFRPPPHPHPQTDATPIGPFLLPDSLALFLLFFFLSLLLWNSPLTAHFRDGGGDVCHYRIQIENLLENKTLDLTDKMTHLMDEAQIPPGNARLEYLQHSHMKINRNGRIYSRHSFGFPLLIAPFIALFGTFGFPLFLSLSSALGLVGCRAACRAAGAPRGAANTMTLLLGFSFMWLFTGRCLLPEMLGCTLCAWAFWAVLAQNQPHHTWKATLVSTLACAYLPFLHSRFSPMALTLFGLFGLEGLLRKNEPFFKQKFPRLASFALLTLSAWTLLALLHAHIFAGTTDYNYTSILCSYPMATWGMFADCRGLVSTMPAIWALAVAPIACLFAPHPPPRWGLWSLLLMTSVLFSCCTNIAALGGACLNGRYLFPCVPALLPPLAIVATRTDPIGRLWFFFLFLLSIAYVFFVLPFTGGALRTPAPLSFLQPFQHLWNPLLSIIHTQNPAAKTASFAFVTALLLLSFLSCFHMKRPHRIASTLALLVFALFTGQIAATENIPNSCRSVVTLCHDYGWNDFQILSGPTPSAYFHTLGCYKPGEYNRQGLYARLTDDPNARRGDYDGPLHHMQRIRPRPLANIYARWIPLTSSPIKAHGKGTIAIWIKGRVLRGSTRLLPLIDGMLKTPGGILLPQGPFNQVLLFKTNRRIGGIHLFASQLNDRGEVAFDQLIHAPFHKGLPPIAGPFPPNAQIITLP